MSAERVIEMLGNGEVMMGVVHEAQVHQATAYSEHRFTARLAARDAIRSQPASAGWKVWKHLGTSRGGRKPS